jgi:site-specific DNA recombinase
MMGYRSRAKYSRDKSGIRTLVEQSGGNKLTDKHLWRLVRNPIYAAVNIEKWTGGEPVKCAFDGIVSIDLFNKANGGKRVIVEGKNKKIYIQDLEAPEHLVKKGRRNPDFAYKKYIMCPQCNKPLLGSTSRGKSGKLYPAYHCNKRGHNVRISKGELDDYVDQFISNLRISPERVEHVYKDLENAWERTHGLHEVKIQNVCTQIIALHAEAIATVGKLKVLTSDTAIKYMEEDLMRIEENIKKLEAKKVELESKKPLDFARVMARAKYFIEHLDELLVKQIDPIKKAQFFGVLFDKVPTYEEIKSRTLISGSLHPLLSLIKNPSNNDESLMVISRRIELRLPG